MLYNTREVPDYFEIALTILPMMSNVWTSSALCLLQLLLLCPCTYAQGSLLMTVKGIPVSDGEEVLLIAEGDYTFQCIHSDSAPISWLLGNSNKTDSATNDNKLTLRKVFLECGLALKCFTDSLSVTVTLKIIIPPEKPEISQEYFGRIENGGTAIICQDKSYTFQCLATGISPEADFQWSLDGKVEKLTVAASNETACTRVDSKDSFTFTADYDLHQDKVLQCRASNEADPMGMTSDVILDVTVPPDSVAITKDGIEITETVQVVSGELTNISCTATNAKPAATIQWTLNGANKTSSSREITTSDGGLEDTTSELSLTYNPLYCKKTLECIAKHPQTDSEISTSISLDVLIPPEKPTISLLNGVVFADEDVVPVTQGDMLTFKCESEGAIPAVDFLWLLGGNMEESYISANEMTDCIPTQGNFQYTLDVDHVTHHSETLQCLVKNEANTDGLSSRVTLVVDALIGFQETEYMVSESDSEVEIILFREGPLDEIASVSLSVSDNSTVEAGSDYRFASILPVTVEFDKGKSAQAVVFFVENDGAFELTEKLVLELDMPNGGKLIPARKTTVITITDSGGVPRCSPDSTGKYSGCKDLETLSKFSVSRDNVEMVADTLADLTEGIPTSKATPSDVNSVARTLDNIAGVKDGSIEVTSSCMEAVDSLLDGLRPSPRNESTKDDDQEDDDITNSTSSIVQSLQKQITLTLRKEGSLRIIEPNVAVEGIVTTRPDKGIGIVVLKDDDVTTDRVTSFMTTTDNTKGFTTTTLEMENIQTMTKSSASHTTSFPSGVQRDNVEFSDENVVRIDDVDDVSDNDTVGLIYVPADFIGRPTDNETPSEAEVIFVCYANPGLFPPDDDDEFIDGVVISANVQPNTPDVPEPTTDRDITQITRNSNESMAPTTESFVSGSMQTTQTSETEPPNVETEAPFRSREPVIIEVVLKEKISKEESRCDEFAQPIIHQCVFWDFDLNDGNGGWSNEGCYLNSSTDNKISCHCDHLTNFAVLASYKEFEHLVLHWISQIGCYISIGALTLTLLIFVLFKEPRKRLASKAPRQVLFQYCISLLLLYIAFVVLIDRTCPEIYCDVGAILLHYLTLSSMMWMGVQSRYLYYKLAKVLYMDYSWFLPLATVLAWGVPIIPIVPTIVLSYESYQNEKYCFLVPGYVLYFGLLLPIGLIILHNLISFIIIMNRLCHNTLPNPGDPERISMKRQFQNGFAMTVLMGLTWAAAFFAIDSATFLFSLIFCVFNSLHGLFVFLLFCLRQSDVYKSFKCCKVEFNREKSFEAEWRPSTHSNPAFALD